MFENEDKKKTPEERPARKPLEEIRKKEKKQWGQLEERPEIPERKPEKDSKND